ncbi:MATE family efflux transporter [Brumimicrobium oceani]|uniref:Multidrug export protein MepA n=1 Tax=Brumimicrobium oceani TaxID=2100725 RepID=A0A2U2XB51_9FLAO|nr:MATE family efflux transporter [Brumimicrobium oceani]PWH85024.1 MATE family efflux transporter [Brumimicrobium oceani]
MKTPVQSKQQQFILNGNLKKVMWKLSLPAILAMVLYGLNAFMDTIYIGQLLNETALAGVALAYPLTSIMLGLGSWVGTGAGNHISVLLGKDDTKNLQRVIPNATIFTLMVSVLFAVPAYLFAEPLIKMMGGTGEVLEYGVSYFKITVLATPLWIYALQLNMIVRSEGKMWTAAFIMAFGLIANLVLTPVAILYCDMGVDGAAWSTNFGMLIYCGMGYLYYQKGKGSFPSNINALTFHKSTFQSILKLGFPGFILSLMGLIQAIVVFNAVVAYGTEDDLSFFAAANRILLFMMTPLFGFMRALQPVSGVNFGAGQLQRVEKAFWLFCKSGFWIVLPFWLIFMIFPRMIIQLVLPNRIMTIAEILNFRIYMAIIPFLPFVFMSLTHLPAIEEPKYASIIGLARQIVFYVPVMLFFPRWFGVSGVYIASTLIDVVITIWLGIIVLKSFKNMKAKKI